MVLAAFESGAAAAFPCAVKTARQIVTLGNARVGVHAQ
jgi:hypothetical protein